jgi:hypothetical protein
MWWCVCWGILNCFWQPTGRRKPVSSPSVHVASSLRNSRISLSAGRRACKPAARPAIPGVILLYYAFLWPGRTRGQGAAEEAAAINAAAQMGTGPATAHRRPIGQALVRCRGTGAPTAREKPSASATTAPSVSPGQMRSRSTSMHGSGLDGISLWQCQVTVPDAQQHEGLRPSPRAAGGLSP